MITSLPAASFVFIFGLMVGSFLNVCIWRLPVGEQVVRGRSICRSCRKVIAWYDNIPLVSFILLKARCRFCGAKISWSYPAVELSTALLLLAVFLRFGASWESVIFGVLAAALILVSVIDLKEMILPDEVTIPGIVIGLILSGVYPQLHGVTQAGEGLLRGFLGALAGGGLTYLIRKIGTWVFKQEAMGIGDIKLMAMIGSLIGVWKVVFVIFFLGPILGSLVGIFVIAKVRKLLIPIPYGPFLALGTLGTIFWGDAIIRWYTSLLGL